MLLIFIVSVPLYERNDGNNYKELVVAAEYACKAAKTNSKNAYAFYNNGMRRLTAYSMDDDKYNRQTLSSKVHTDLHLYSLSSTPEFALP